jgi:hypothetical protein
MTARERDEQNPFDIESGDWIAWSDGASRTVRYGRVEYVRRLHEWPYRVELHTSGGGVTATSVLEVRKGRC